MFNNSAMRYCHNIKQIIVPDSVTTINQTALNNMATLTTVIFPDSISVLTYQLLDLYMQTKWRRNQNDNKRIL